MYSLQSYNPAIDGNYRAFLIGTLIVQIVLLCASLLMHLWLIRHASDVAEAIGFLKFKFDHSAISKKITRLQADDVPTNDKAFLTETQKFTRELNAFKRKYPEAADDILKTIPADVLHEMHSAMGHQLFSNFHSSQN